MTPRRGRSALPAGVWALGFTSLLMDVSSEMIHALLPVFLVSVLGASALAVGIIEGVAEATALLTKVVSGAVSDWIGKRKGLAVLGYGLAASTKPLFALASTVGLVLFARFADRVGKGIRGAPRDALVADLTEPELRGRAFGLRQGLDTLGAVGGPLLAAGLMVLWAGDIRAVFWVAVIPAFMSVVVLVVGVREPARPAVLPRTRFPIRRENLRLLPGAFWIVTGIGAVFSLARFSEAFLVLRASDVMPTAAVPLVLVVMNAVYALVVYPVGVHVDRGRSVVLLAGGVAALVVAQLVLAAAGGSAGLVLLGAGLWGVHLGMTQGLLATLVSWCAPGELRATAFGLFNVVSGVALLIGSVLAGWLWVAIGPDATFLAGAVFAVLTLLGVLGTRRLVLPEQVR